ncbi:general stress protein [Pontibacter harenae]|uniref:general stress protein n=1 Tax=Pontibacter harenae TaxID=2894083 RepID=UPI001E5FD521|nr:general stress protein [Pontibacter harenae]MCC9168509.1 general stress protein [Pontibacter harenae]
MNRTDSDSGMMTAMFRDRESAERAYNELRARGYDNDDINVVMSDDARKRHFGDDDADDTTELGNKSLEGTGAGSAIGGTLGAIVGAVAAIGTSVAIPGLGLVVAGPLAAGLAGAGAGGLTGGLIGALVGAGIPEERAKVYESGVQEGNIVIGFKPRSQDDVRHFESHFQSNRGEHVYY